MRARKAEKKAQKSENKAVQKIINSLKQAQKSKFNKWDVVVFREGKAKTESNEKKGVLR